MSHKNFEQNTYREKMKEIAGLFLFIIIAAVVSIFVMNAITLPISFFAVSNRKAFTILFVVLVILLLTLLISFKIFGLYTSSKREGISFRSSLLTGFLCKLRNIGFVISVLLLASCAFYIIAKLLIVNHSIINNILK